MYDDGTGRANGGALPFTARKSRELAIKELDKKIATAEAEFAHAHDFFMAVAIGDTAREFVELRKTVEVNTTEYRAIVAAAERVKQKLQAPLLDPVQRLALEKTLTAAEETISVAEERHQRASTARRQLAPPSAPAADIPDRQVVITTPRQAVSDTVQVAQPEQQPPPRAASYRILRTSLSPPPAENNRSRQVEDTPDAFQTDQRYANFFASPLSQVESIARRSSASQTVPTRHTSEAFVQSAAPLVHVSPVKRNDQVPDFIPPPPAIGAASVPRIIVPSRIEYRSASVSPRRTDAAVTAGATVNEASSLPSTVAEGNNGDPSPPRVASAPNGPTLLAPPASTAGDSFVLSPSTPTAVAPPGATKPREVLYLDSSMLPGLDMRRSPLRAASPVSVAASAGGTQHSDMRYSRVNSIADTRTPPPTSADGLPRAPSADAGTQDVLLSELQRLTGVVGSLAERIAASDAGRMEQARRLDELATLTRQNAVIGETVQLVSERCTRNESSVLGLVAEVKAISARLQAMEQASPLRREEKAAQVEQSWAPFARLDEKASLQAEQTSAGVALVDGRFRQVASTSTSRAHSPTSAALPGTFPINPPPMQAIAASPPFHDVTPAGSTGGSPHHERSFPPNAAGSPARSLRVALVTSTSLVDSREPSPQVPPPAAPSPAAADAHFRRLNSAKSDSSRQPVAQTDIKFGASRTAESIS